MFVYVFVLTVDSSPAWMGMQRSACSAIGLETSLTNVSKQAGGTDRIRSSICTSSALRPDWEFSQSKDLVPIIPLSECRSSAALISCTGTGCFANSINAGYAALYDDPMPLRMMRSNSARLILSNAAVEY